MSEELVVLENLNAVELYTANGGTDEILGKIRESVINVIPDVSTAKGRAEIANRSASVSKKKVILIKMGNALKEDLKAQLKPITLETTKVKDYCDALRVEVREPLTNWENDEKERVSELKERLAGLEFSIDHYTGCDIEDIKLHLKQSESFTLNTSTYGEFLDEAKIAYPIYVESLTIYLNKLIAEKKQADELAKLQAEKVVREKLEREEAIRKEAAEKAEKEAAEAIEKSKQATLKAEREKKAAEDLAESNRLAAIEHEKQQKEEYIKREEQAKIDAEKEKSNAIEAERQRVQKIKEDEEKAAAKKAANKKHRGTINRAALEDLQGLGIDEDLAKKIVTAIAKEQIRNITVNY
jgi:colicin import membrane protein